MNNSLLVTGTRLLQRGDLHLLRKIWHMGTGLTGLALYMELAVAPEVMGTILVSLGLVALIFETVRLRSLQVNQLFIRVLGPLMRDSEQRGYTGFPFYALGAGLSLLLFPEKVAVLSVLFLIFADPISSLFGIMYGRVKIIPNKSLEGAFAGFVTCYSLATIYALYYQGSGVSVALFALFAGALGSFSEFISGKIDDNLTIPLISGAGLTLLNSLFQIF